jgi:predicted deacetylase
MHTVILRDDDTCAFTPRECLERLYRPFLDRGLPVNLAVIPEVRTDVRMPDGRLEGFLAAGRGPPGPLAPIAASTGLVDYLHSEDGYHIAQHGCHHDYFEFGSSDRGELVRRLERGADGLREAGFTRAETFVAPYDRISRTAYLEIARRFAVISTGWFEAGRVPLRWWPQYIRKKLRRRPHWRAGRTALLSHPGCLLSFHHPRAEMFASVRRAVESQPLTVLVTHWWEYFRDGNPDEEFIRVLHQVAEWLAGHPEVRVVSFRDVADGKVSING